MNSCYILPYLPNQPGGIRDKPGTYLCGTLAGFPKMREEHGGAGQHRQGALAMAHTW